MADDRMKNDDLQRNMGNKEGQNQGQNFGQQSPGRTGQPGEGQHAGGQQQGGGQFGGQKNPRDTEDDDLGTGGQPGNKNRGGENR